MLRRVRRKRWFGALGFYAVAAMLVLGCSGAEAGDAATGQKLAKEWCSACHYVGSGAAASDAAPAFAEIANDPSATPERWRNWLIDPHPPMPNFSLSRGELDAIVAYLESLKEE